MRQLVVLFMIVALGVQSLFLVPAQAAMISTDSVLASENATTDDRARLNALMQREEVRAEMRRHGIDPDEAAARVAALSDAEVAEVSAKLDEMPAGQNAIGIIVGAAVLIFLVLLVTDLLCLTSVFDFTRCAGK